MPASPPSAPVRLEPGPLNALTDVPGIEVGHYTHPEIYRGVTAILAKKGASAGVAVRGSNPGTIHTDALAPTALGSLVHGIGLSGGSLFGLAAIAGITQWLLDQRIGEPIRDAIIPIVPGAVIYDLGFTDPFLQPTAEWGRQAAEVATSGPFERGNVGAGRGGTMGDGPGCVRAKGGLGTSSLRLPGGIVVGALVVINAMGSVINPVTGKLHARDGGFDIPLLYQHLDSEDRSTNTSLTNTTLGVIATNAALETPQLTKIADLTHDGLARAIRPMHAMRDGDTVFALSTYEEPVRLPETTGPNMTDLIGHAAADAMVLAVLDAVEQIEPLGGLPSVAQAQAALMS